MSFIDVKRNMKLSDVLSVIDDNTFIIIYFMRTKIFHKEKCKVYRFEYYGRMEKYLDKEVIRIDTVDGAVAIYI